MRKSFLVSILIFLLTGALSAGIEEIIAEREESIIRLFVKGDFEYEVLKLPPPEKGVVVYIKSPLPDKYRDKSYTFGGVRITAKSADDETRIYMRSPLDFDLDYYKASAYLVVSLLLKGSPVQPPISVEETKPVEEAKKKPKPKELRTQPAVSSQQTKKPMPSYPRRERRAKGAYYLRIRGAKEELVLKALSILEGKTLFPRDPERRVYAIAKGLTYEEALRLIFSH